MIKVTYVVNGIIERDMEFSPTRFLNLLKADLNGEISISEATIGDFKLNCTELQNNLIL